MSQYIKGVMSSPEYPDLALVGQTIVHINNIPKEFTEDVKIASLQEELQNLAERSGEIFHTELAADVHVTRGSLIVDVFFNCELPTLLSKENLVALGVYFEDNFIISGVKDGAGLYIIYRTFRAIKRLDRAMSKVCGTLKGYIYIRLSAAKNVVRRDKEEIKLGESRRGFLGLLARLYDAVDVCNSTSDIKKRLDAMKRVSNAIGTINDSISRNEDRKFLCDLILPLLENIKVAEPSKSNEKEDINDYIDYNKHREQSIKLTSGLSE